VLAAAALHSSSLIPRARQKTLAATNNLPSQAAVNAMELKKMLGGKKVKAPKQVVEHCPEQLNGIAQPI
jgi:hypothetical protein